MSSNHCSHIKELNDVKNIIYCCDECASKFSEALKPAHNSRYVAALGVYEEFLRSAEYINGDGFRPWLKACLNPPKAAECT